MTFSSQIVENYQEISLKTTNIIIIFSNIFEKWWVKYLWIVVASDNLFIQSNSGEFESLFNKVKEQSD